MCAGFVILVYGTSLVMTIVVRTYWAQAFRTPTPGMEPSLLVGDYFFVNKRGFKQRAPYRGEIVAFGYPVNPQLAYVKRIVGLPGDEIEVSQGILSVNRQRISSEPLSEGKKSELGLSAPVRSESFGEAEYFVMESPRGQRKDQAPFLFPPDSYFVLGDNRNNSADSRFWGPVPQDLLIGPATHIYWSFHPGETRIRWQRIGRKIH
jgi:signal peptidase I